jgi:hypothetical protein
MNVWEVFDAHFARLEQTRNNLLSGWTARLDFLGAFVRMHIAGRPPINDSCGFCVGLAL